MTQETKEINDLSQSDFKLLSQKLENEQINIPSIQESSLNITEKKKSFIERKNVLDEHSNPIRLDTTNESTIILKEEDTDILSPPAHILRAINHTRVSSSPLILNSPEPQISKQKLVIVMVGLPARGKSYIARGIMKYLNWIGVKTRTFNAGEYRRQILGKGHDSNFFDANDKESSRKRELMSVYALDDMVGWLSRKKGQVGILDATNTTRNRREFILNRLLGESELNFLKQDIIFIESICDDERIIENNVRHIKIKGEDYKHLDPETAFQDFINRIEQYKKVYEPLSDEHDQGVSYIKMIDFKRKVILNRISGFIQGKIVNYLMNVHVTPRKIFLTRHGESKLNVEGRIGGDTYLSPKGKCYKKVLKEFFEEQNIEHLVVWTSTMKRTIETAELLIYPQIQYKALDEIHAGSFDGMTYEEIKLKFPKEYEERAEQKYNYRYPRGESYKDLVNRLEHIILELERLQTSVVIVCHQAVMRVMYAYLTGRPPEDCIQIETNLHEVWELIPTPNGYAEKIHHLENRVQDIFDKTQKTTERNR